MIFLSAIGLGLAGSLHCVGMCGPIALAVPVGRGDTASKAIAYFLYHFGRITGYAILGFLFGILGYGLNLAGLQQSLSLAAGAFMLLFIWAPRLTGLAKADNLVLRAQSKVTRYMAVRLKSHRAQALLGLGLFNGFLPCGFVYLALAGALLTYGPWSGAGFMAAFGLGTAPALIALALAGHRFGTSFRSRFRRLAPLLATAVAVLFILRGLGLGIPYVSPEPGFVINATESCP